MSQTHFRTCHLCETMCGIAVEYSGDEILSIRGDEDHVLSKGNICPKSSGLQDVHTDPDRLRKPVKKIHGEWHEISWDEAFEEVASRLAELQRQHGLDAVASYVGRSIAHNIGALLTVMPTRMVMGTKNVYTASTVDQQPHNFVWYFMFGHQLMATIPDLDRTDYYLMLGTNPKISNGAQMATGANVYKKLDAIRARGGKVVLIDPRRTETAEHCSEHHFIRPSTDALFLMGLVKVIFERGLATPGRLADHIVGWDEIEPITREFDLLEIAEVTGIAVEDIERIAVDLASAKSAICYGRTGLSMQEFGGLCNWLMMVINVITGNIDEPGGMTFPLPAIDALDTVDGARGSYDRYRSRVRGRPEFAGEFPVSVLAEEIMTPGEGQIRGLIGIAGNGALSLPNGKIFEEALDQLDFMVSIDLYINETTRHADIILPAVGPFEKSHYDLFYHTYDTINWTAYNPPLFEPEAPGYTDFEIMGEVLTRLVVKRTRNPFKKIFAKLVGAFVRKWVTPELILDLGLRFGPYGAGLNPFDREGLSLKKLKQHPHGIYLGEHERCLPKRLFNKEKKIYLAPEVIVADIPRLNERWLSGQRNASAEFDMVIVGRLQQRTLGWMHNSHRLVKGKDTCTLFIHPDDASVRGIEDGSVVAVSSAAGSIQLPAEINDTVMPGVVCMPPLWGHNRPGTRRAVANAHPGASMNDITNQEVMDELTGNAVVHGVPVKVEPVENLAVNRG
jgi:anaerobic selenocysteine-containing dehydrogenase